MEKITKTTRTRATKDVMKVEKPLVIKNGSVVLNDYFMVDIGVYKIMERNIKKATNTLLLGPTGVKINIA